MTATINKGSNPAALRPGIDEWIGLGYAEIPEQWAQFYAKKMMRMELEKAVGLVGMDLPRRYEEDEANQYTTMRQNWQKLYQASKYRLCYIVTEENMRSVLYSEVAEFRSKAAGRKLREAKEILGAAPLNSAFSSATTDLAYDGLPLASTAHVLANGGTFSNRAASHANISELVVESAVNQIRRDYRDDTNSRLQIRPVRLMVPVNMQFEAYRIQNSILRVGTANNDPNAMKDMGIWKQQPLVLDYLTDQTAFFILTDCEQGFEYRQQWPLETELQRDFETGGFKTKLQEKYTHDVTNFRCLWAMPGA